MLIKMNHDIQAKVDQAYFYWNGYQHLREKGQWVFVCILDKLQDTGLNLLSFASKLSIQSTYFEYKT